MTDSQVGDTQDLRWLYDFFQQKARGRPTSADAHLWSVGDAIALPECKTVIRTHFLKQNANGIVRVEPLATVLANRVLDYCMPRSQIEAAQEADRRDGSTEAVMQLGNEAKAL